MQGKLVGNGLASGGQVALHVVGEGIEAHRGQHLLGHGLHQLRVDKGHFRIDQVSPQGLLVLGLGVGQHRKGVGLAPCAAGGGYLQNGQATDTLLSTGDIVIHVTAVHRAEGHRLGRIHHGAAAHADDQIAPLLPGQGRALHNRGGQGVGLHLIEYRGADARGLQQGDGAVQQTGAFRAAAARHDQGVGAVALGRGAQLVDHIGAKQQADRHKVREFHTITSFL